MGIPPKGIRIPRIYHWTRRGQDRPSQDRGHLGLDYHQENQGNPVIPRILQLLQEIYTRFQEDGQTTIRKNKKERYRQLGMRRQRTTRIRRIKNQTHHNTRTGLLRPSRTDQDRNRRFKVHMFRDTVAAMQRREMETSGVPIQNNVEPECNYDIHDKELLAIVQVLYKWK